MNKNIKTTLIVIIGLLALITLVGLIYGIQNKIQTNNIYTSYSESILTAVDTAVKTCQSAFNSVGATDEEMINLNDYITNINEAESPVLKAYIADSMLTYTGDFVMVKGQNYSLGIEGSKAANFTGIQEKLVTAKSQLSAARNYNNEE